MAGVGRAHCVLTCMAMLLLIGPGKAYEFDMVFQTKCVMEEVSAHSEITGSYQTINRDHVDENILVNIKIDNPENEMMYQDHGVPHGVFSFIAEREGDYKICFTVNDFPTAQRTRINLDWRSGSAAHDWELVAKKDNLNFVQTELLSLEESIHDIHIELQRIRRKEEQMRDINESTNARVAWLSIGALLVCLALSAWQMSYLQRFFKRKKLL